MIQWALGDLDAVPAPVRDDTSGSLAVVVVCVLAVLFGLLVDPELDRVVRGLSHLVLYGLTPLAVLWSTRREAQLPGGLEVYGLGPGEWRWWLPRVCLGLLALTVVDTSAMLLFDDLRAFYPPEAARSSVGALLWALAGVGIDLFGWEMLFRGVLLGALARLFGVRPAIGLAAFLFFVGHLDKPLSELISSLPGGVVAGWFAWRARSFLPVYLLHLWQLVTVYGVGFALAQAVTPTG